jgi:hypothetical protein
MAYFIYNQAANNQIYKIAENQTDLDSLELPQNQYLIINGSQIDFDDVKLNNKYVLNYNGSSVQVENVALVYTREQLNEYIQNIINTLNYSVIGHPQNIKNQQWLDYINVLKTLNVFEIIVPPEKFLIGSLELYLKNNNKPYYNLLQVA